MTLALLLVIFFHDTTFSPTFFPGLSGFLPLFSCIGQRLSPWLYGAPNPPSPPLAQQTRLSRFQDQISVPTIKTSLASPRSSLLGPPAKTGVTTFFPVPPLSPMMVSVSVSLTLLPPDLSSFPGSKAYKIPAHGKSCARPSLLSEPWNLCHPFKTRGQDLHCFFGRHRTFLFWTPAYS